MAEGPMLSEQIRLMDQILELEAKTKNLMTQKVAKYQILLESVNPQVI